MKATFLALVLLTGLPARAEDSGMSMDEILEELASLRERSRRLEALVAGRHLAEDVCPGASWASGENSTSWHKEVCDHQEDTFYQWFFCNAGTFWSVATDALLIGWPGVGVSVLGYVAMCSVGNFYHLTWSCMIRLKFIFCAVFTANFFFFDQVNDHPTLYTYAVVVFGGVLSDFVCSLDSVRAKHYEWSEKSKNVIHQCEKEMTLFEVELSTRKSHCDYCIKSKYRELSHRFSNVVMYFIVQLALFCLYSFHLMGMKDYYFCSNEIVAENIDMSFWCISVLLGILATESTLGNQYNALFWEDLYDMADKGPFNGKPSPNLMLGFTFKTEWRLRRCMAFIVNGLMRPILLGTIPILISVNGPLDAIKDLMGVTFIVTLDDLPDGKSLIEELTIIYQSAFPDDEMSTKLKEAALETPKTEDVEAETTQLVPTQD